MTAGTCEACGHEGQVHPALIIQSEDSDGHVDELYRPGDLCPKCWTYAMEAIDAAIKRLIAMAEKERGGKQ